ncbi:MAG: OsmC family protein [Sulfitobacter sp.]
MTIRPKPKTFGPLFAHFDGTQTVQYTNATSAPSPHLPEGTPVDMLLASLAYCMIKSAEWAAKDQGVTLQPFVVKVTGTKALDQPGRIERMDVTLIGDLVEASALAGTIVKQAKAICTVSNTLNCKITVTTEPGP